MDKGRWVFKAPGNNQMVVLRKTRPRQPRLRRFQMTVRKFTVPFHHKMKTAVVQDMKIQG